MLHRHRHSIVRVGERCVDGRGGRRRRQIVHMLVMLNVELSGGHVRVLHKVLAQSCRIGSGGEASSVCRA